MAFTNVASQELETGVINIGSSNPISQSFTIPDLAANSIGWVELLVHGVAATTPVISSVTWGGQAMTKAIPASNNMNTAPQAHLWYLVNPPDNGSQTIVINFSAPSVAVSATCHLVVGYADANNPVSLDDTSEETGSGIASIDIVSTQAGADELVISGSAHTANDVGSPTTTGCTELQNYDSGGNCSIAAFSIPTASGDATHQHNYSQNGTYAIVSMSFKETSSGYTLTADAGSYTLTGQTANLLASRKLTADAGSYTLSGQTANLLFGRRLAADAGSYTLTGQDASLLINRILVASAGTFILTGQDAGLRAARKLTADSGTFALTGQDASLIVDRLLSAAAGSYVLTGQDATLTYSGGGLTHYTLTAEAGSYTLTGQSAGLTVARILTAASGAFTVTGQDASLIVDRILQAGAGSYTLSGQDASLLRGYLLSAGAGAYNITGQDAALTVDRILSAEAGSYTLTGIDVTLLYSGASTPTPTDRIYVIGTENRVFVIVADSRVLPVASENRIYSIEE